MATKTYSIHERIYAFILDVLAFLKTLPKTFEDQVFIGQLTRAVTSMGANDQEANGTLTKADFIHCYTVVRKEGKESLYWLRLIGDSNKDIEKTVQPLIKEGDELVSIVTSIIFNTKKKL